MQIIIIKNIVNIYNSFSLIKTTLYLAHGPYLSLYNIQEKKWLKHIKFNEGDILKLVKFVTYDSNNNKQQEEIK